MEWTAWVLRQEELPEIPATLPGGASLPIAWWTSRLFGVVLHIQWFEDEDGPRLGAGIDFAIRKDEAFESIGSFVGGRWPHRTRVILPIAPKSVYFDGEMSATCLGRECRATFGVLGEAGGRIEMASGEGLAIVNVDSPCGAFVLCTESEEAATVSLYGAGGRMLGQRQL
jgi:hypothetical protein